MFPKSTAANGTLAALRRTSKQAVSDKQSKVDCNKKRSKSNRFAPFLFVMFYFTYFATKAGRLSAAQLAVITNFTPYSSERLPMPS